MSDYDDFLRAQGFLVSGDTDEPCCESPALQRMARSGSTNTICLSCKAHWYGREGAVRRFTGKQWDDLLSKDFERSRMTSAAQSSRECCATCASGRLTECYANGVWCTSGSQVVVANHFGHACESYSRHCGSSA